MKKTTNQERFNEAKQAIHHLGADISAFVVGGQWEAVRQAAVDIVLKSHEAEAAALAVREDGPG